MTTELSRFIGFRGGMNSLAMSLDGDGRVEDEKGGLGERHAAGESLIIRSGAGCPRVSDAVSFATKRLIT